MFVLSAHNGCILSFFLLFKELTYPNVSLDQRSVTFTLNMSELTLSNLPCVLQRCYRGVTASNSYAMKTSWTLSSDQPVIEKDYFEIKQNWRTKCSFFILTTSLYNLLDFILVLFISFSKSSSWSVCKRIHINTKIHIEQSNSMKVRTLLNIH